MVAETIFQAERKTDLIRVRHERMDFPLRAAARGEVELVALVDELRKARRVILILVSVGWKFFKSNSKTRDCASSDFKAKPIVA